MYQSRRRSLGILTSLATALALTVGGLALASSATADTMPPDPTNPASPPTVGAYELPTTQIDGVAWAQVVVGNTVYVAGKFTTARPAGSPAGSNTTPRSNLLAYNVTTGVLISSFNVPLNAQGLAITASPDGTRVYVGGDFTTAGGGAYYRIVAIDTSTGLPITSFRPSVGSQVRAITATNTSVYIGGTFTSVNGVTRNHLAKLNASNGSVDSTWVANADDVVDAIAVHPDGNEVYAGGRFTHMDGTPQYGLAMVTGASGSILPFPVNTIIRDAGVNASITSLIATTDRVYGSGYVFGSGGNFEGSFSADPVTGSLIWMEDCHGDTYSVFPMANALYLAGHPHDCRNVGAFPETSPRTFHHTIAFSKATTGTLTNDGNPNYYNFSGRPSPTQLNWYPAYVTGTFTGQGQAAWTVSGNGQYVVVGGEFPYVNNVAQYGLTRYAMDSVVKSKVGPNSNTALTPNATSSVSGQAKVTWTATYDQDNVNLTYTLVRDGDTAHPVYSVNKVTRFWSLPGMSFTDTGLSPGSTHSYRLYVTDPDGNQISRLGNTVTINGSTSSTTASDTFSRTVSSGWGSADVGGGWTVSGTSTAYSVASGTGRMSTAAGTLRTSTLTGVSTSSTDSTVTVTTDVAPTGGGLYASAIGRSVGSSTYEGRAWLQSSGAVQVQLLQGSTMLQSATVSGLTYTAGEQLMLRVEVFGASPTTVRAKVWAAGQTQPASWQLSATDSTSGLQGPGAVGLRSYLSSSANVTPVTAIFDNYSVVAAQ